MYNHRTEYMLIGVCVLYGFLAILVNRNIFGLSTTPYYNFFLDALFHKRMNVLTPIHYDLSFFHGKWYLNWGPAPILYILPFFLIGGKYTSDIVYTLIAGIGNCFLFYCILIQCKKYFSLKITFLHELFIFIGFSICSPNLYLSLIGQVWSTEQIVGTLYLLLAYLCFFLFLNEKKVSLYIIAVCFFNLAWLSRYTLFFSFPIFLYPFFLQKEYSKGEIKRLEFIFIGITIAAISLLFTYNYIKFENIFDTGLRYHHGAKRYTSIIQSHEFVSLEYIPQNVYYDFLNFVSFSAKFPFVHINTEGNSIFSLYPSVLILVYVIKKVKIFSQKIKVFILLGFLPIIFTLMFITLYFATGWRQLGVRYFLDIAPLVYLLLIFVIIQVPKSLLKFIFSYEIIVNVLSVIHYFYFPS